MLTKLDRYECEGQLSIFDYLKAADPEPEQEPEKEIEVGKWVDEHGPRVMFDDIKEGHYYIADYSTESHKWYKIIFVKWKKGDDVGYTDAPKGVTGRWKWGNNHSCLTRKINVNADEGRYSCCGMADTNGWWYDLPDAAADPEQENLSPAQEYFKDTGKTTYWQDSEGKPFQWWKTKSTCEHSGHICNKAELWKVADTLDGINCPHSCCRICAVNNCGARCNGSEEPPKLQDEYIKENPTCFYVFGHYLDRADGWHKVPEELPTFTEWTLIDAVVFGKKTGSVWMEDGKWEAKDWAFRSVDDRRNTESVTVLAWKLSEEGNT